MKKEDESELHRLCALLKEINDLPSVTPVQKEALEKAALSLHLCFIAGQRERVELLYANAPLTEQEKEKLRSYGIDPDKS